MGIIEDIMHTLDRIPAWKRLQQVPSEVDALKERVVALEEKLIGKWPADVCRRCGARAARLGHSTYDKPIIIERWDCSDCGEADFRHRKA